MPASAVKAVYAAISPESVQSGQLMLYPCKTSVTLSLKFGGIVYDVPSDAFSYGWVHPGFIQLGLRLTCDFL